jgi:hypothetical protein
MVLQAAAFVEIIIFEEKKGGKVLNNVSIILCIFILLFLFEYDIIFPILNSFFFVNIET